MSALSVKPKKYSNLIRNSLIALIATAVVLFIFIALSGPPRLVGTDRDAFLDSVEEIAYDLPERERINFVFMLMRIYSSESTAGYKTPDYDMYAVFDGMSVDDVLELGWHYLENDNRGMVPPRPHEVGVDIVKYFKDFVVTVDGVVAEQRLKRFGIEP